MEKKCLFFGSGGSQVYQSGQGPMMCFDQMHL